MTQLFLFASLLLIAIGQVIAVLHSRRAGVAYYIAVAPLGGLALWYYITWDTARICGAVLVATALVRYRPLRHYRAQRNLVLALFFYGLAATLWGMGFWPKDVISTPSPAYSELRALVSIANWAIMLGVSWQIALVFAEQNFLATLKKPLILSAAVLSLFAIFQYYAHERRIDSVASLGVRRPSSVMLNGEQTLDIASYRLGDEDVYRPGSLVGEPKALGAACVLWLTFCAGAIMKQRRNRFLVALVLSTVLTALWFTASSSAWASTICAFAVLLIGSLSGGNKMVSRRLFIGVFILFMAFVGLTLMKPPDASNEGRISEIVQQRLVDRISGSAVGDTAETYAIETLSNAPALAIFGAGLGGISFYVAERLGGSDLVLYPNNGLLAMVSDIGFLGLLLICLATRNGLKAIYTQVDADTKSLAICGAACFLQCCIFPQPWLLSVCFGLLTGVSLRSSARREMRRHATSRLDPPRCTAVLPLPESVWVSNTTSACILRG